MRQKRKWLVLFSVMCVFLLCGCSKGEETSKERVEKFLTAYQQRDLSYTEYLENVEENSVEGWKDFQSVLAEQLTYVIQSAETGEEYDTVQVLISTVDCAKGLDEVQQNHPELETKEDILKELETWLQEENAPRREAEVEVQVTKEGKIQLSLELSDALLGGYHSYVAESSKKAIAESYGTVSAWEYADYDGNGTKEAFAVITDGEMEIVKTLFISSKGEVTEMEQDLGWALYINEEGYIRQVGDQGFFWADMGGYGSGWCTLLYSVKEDVPYILQLSGSLQGFYEQDGILYTTENEFLPEGGHLYPKVELIYDSDTREFTKGERIELDQE